MSIQINGTTGISGVNGTAGSPAIQGSDANTGISFGTDEVLINTGGTERAKIDASGYLRLAAGGIQFKGDTAAANALDEYEEGTWTPTYVGSTTTPSINYAEQYGRYTRIGNVCHVEARLVIGSNTGDVSGGSGNLYVDGLPFDTATSANPPYIGSGFTIGFAYLWTTNTPIYLLTSSGDGDRVYLYHDSNNSYVQTSNLGVSTYLQFSGCYRVD